MILLIPYIPTQGPLESPAESLLEQLRELGIDLKAEGGNLRFRAPKDALTIGLKQQIVEHKSEVLALSAAVMDLQGQHEVPVAGSEPLPEQADRAG